jgi:pyruvate kinase
LLRRTKIVATLGPATDDPKILDKLIEAGVDVVRLNFSHDRHEVHAKRAEAARERCQAHGKHVGVIVDLQGPKIRIGKFKNGPVTLAEGDKFIIDASHPLDAGTTERIGTTYKSLPQDVSRGSTLLLDDGRISLWVEKVEGTEVVCRVVNGGVLDNNKGINRQGGGLSAAALTARTSRPRPKSRPIISPFRSRARPRMSRRRAGCFRPRAAKAGLSPRSSAPRRSRTSRRLSAPRMWS